MEIIELLKEKILYKRIKEMTEGKLVLDDGTEVYFECTDWDCCSEAYGKWDNATLDAVITDVELVIEHVYYEGDQYDGMGVNTAKLVIFHNQNSVAQANLYADCGGSGYYSSVLSVFVGGKNLGRILWAGTD